MKIVADEANWFIKPYDHTTKRAHLFVMKTPIVSSFRRTRSTKMKIPLNKSQVRELIQELQEIEKLLEEEIRCN